MGGGDWYNRAKKLTAPNGTIETYAESTYQILFFLAEFGREICQEQTQKMRKSDKEQHFQGYEVEKSKLPKGTSRAPTKSTYSIILSQRNLGRYGINIHGSSQIALAG